MNATLNGAPRKKLSDQLDRLDNILDGLSDAIPAVVADAVRHAVREGGKAAIAEILTNPDLLQATRVTSIVAPTVGTAPSPVPTLARSFISRVTKGVWAATRWVGSPLGTLSNRSLSVVTAASGVMALGWALIQPLLPSLSTVATWALVLGFGLFAVPLID